MTIFIIGSVFETAKALDVKRFNKQIVECSWMINMAEGKSKPSNHPAYLMYKDNIDWVKKYRDCFIAYKNGNINEAKILSDECDTIKPDFLCEDLYINFKKRLYTKDNSLYSDWKSLGETEANFYFVDGHWIKYDKGKKSVDENFGKH